MGNVITVVVLLIIVAAVALIGYYIYQGRAIYQQSTTQTLAVDTARCKYDLNKLVDITNRPCCVVAGTPTSLKYISEYNLVVSPAVTNYVTACSGFCTNGVDYTANPPVCIGGVGQTNFDSCVNLTAPTGCSDAAVPIAVNTSTPYYAYSATSAGCPDQTFCFYYQIQ